MLGVFHALDMSAEVLDKRSWLEATQYCTLLGSNNTGDVLIEKINIPGDIADDQYWVGAIVNRTLWFEVSAVRVQVSGSEVEEVDPPFLLNCHFLCKGQGAMRFTLMGKQCSCQQQQIRTSQGFGVPLYLGTNFRPSRINGSIKGDCVAFTRTMSAEYHEMLPCGTMLPPICHNESMSQISRNWTEAVTSCSVRPEVSFSVLSRYNITGGTTGWTGITRGSYGRIWATGPGEDSRLFGCVAVNVSTGSSSLLEFPCSTKLTPLCEQGAGSKETATNEATENIDTTTSLAVGLASGFGLLVILIVTGVFVLKRKNRLKARRSSKVSFHNKNYEVGMEGLNIPPMYAEVSEYVNGADKTPRGNPRDSGGSESTYDHARVQSPGRILSDDDYDHLQ